MSQQGHYADPLSPIASTPIKRQHTKAAEKNNVLLSSLRSKDDEKMFSPRKLLETSDKQNQDAGKSRVKKARTLDYESVSSTDGKQEEDVGVSTSEDANDELFSPVLKPPKTSRSASASPPDTRVRVDSAAIRSYAQPTELTEEVNIQEVSCMLECDSQDEEESTPLEQDFNPFYFMKTLPKYEDIVEGKRPISLPERSRHAPKICLVLDLDETLVHCSVDEVKDPHLKFPVMFNGVKYTVNVKKRPHMEYFLKRVSRLFEIVVFTASHKVYAEKLIDLLDPHRNLIRYRLYRDDCLDVFGNYLKDLNVLGRDLSKVVLVDNSPHAFGYQVNNETLVDVEDVRPIVEKQFQIQKLIDATPDGVSCQHIIPGLSTAVRSGNMRLWVDSKDRRKYEDLADLFAIFKTTEHLEAAYVRDAITPEEYTEACTKLISQFKTAETALRLGGFIESVESFVAEYKLDCPRAFERLVRIGVPATVVHNTTNRKTDSVNVAQTVQNFITLMDVLKLNIRAVDEIQPLLSEMMSSLTMVSGLPPDFAGRDKIEGWLRTMNAMRASDELNEEQTRQLSYDLERAYSSFMAFLNK
ncbi:nuclear lim factor interactor-interacting protein hyphal [Plasmopara halstedii]|uniref:Nuclear lim factor interactor-interacting protein hyphal n=1 Tax=Plasmopara halstedii TaxID=4781 RepID=A0A0P1AH45_PLAHL|nr:nuclear lim factor interactor-interacting protein hyphal [Plasmopara halstedii]CEG40120.1 nuclear lim factor interactor-interacting protein hyphal [Plasmopara halstedii]|eukprot:XP_024576489.1 nuclear lim factor interactor-interacting protein hyphal [Plasmopara halstedii]